MRYKLLIFSLLIVFGSCASNKTEIEGKAIKFPFGLCKYNGGVLISNLGGKIANYSNQEQKGFISFYKNGKTTVLFPQGSGLYSPKGMALKDNFLFVADVGGVVVLDMINKKVIDKIDFPQKDAFVCDVLIMGSTLFISVTNYNKIYLLNIENPAKIDHKTLLEYIELPYPSSIKSMGEYIFVASNSFSKTDYEDKIIHIIDDLNNPSIRPIIHERGDYQGLEFSEGKTRLIFCNQEKNGYIGNLIFENGEYTYEKIAEENSLFTSLLLFDKQLYICDLQNSKIYIKNLIEFDNFATIIETTK